MSKFYKHYKNKPYKYLGVVHHSETQEALVLYESLYKNDLGPLWVRPQKMFHENVVINGKEQARFAKVLVDYRQESNVSPENLELIENLLNKTFASFEKNKISHRLKDQKNILLTMAWIENEMVGFKLGYALDKNIFYSWLGSMEPQYENLGIAQDLMQKQHQWARKQGFQFVETRCLNRWRKMMILNLKNGFDIIGTDKNSKDEMKIIFRKDLNV